MKLTKKQKEIVDLESGQHLVLSPPGTGKTELLVHRVLNAIENGVNQEEMICLTFTNRSAKNMSKRVEHVNRFHKVFIGNVHNFCNTFIREQRIISQNISLIDEDDVQHIFSDLLDEIECLIYRYGKLNTISAGELTKFNTYLKQKSLNFPTSILENPNLKFLDIKKAVEICNRYERIKRESNFIDFDDLLTLTYNYLNQNPDYKIFKWLQIDEVQDLNLLQWGIIAKISNKLKTHRVFFGDYEQSIFSFIGARIEILDTIYKNSTIHQLQDNFRSPQYLLDIYNTYATELLDPKWSVEPKSLKLVEKSENSLMFKTFPDENSEIRWIVDEGIKSSDTAILVKTNKIADKFAIALEQKGIDFFKVSGSDLFKTDEVKYLMAFLNILIHPKDRSSWIRNLSLYGKIPNFRESRYFVNNLFNIGFEPLDFLEEKLYLDDFSKKFQNRRFIVFDTETTGLDILEDDIIQISAIEIIDGKVGKVFDKYLNTDKDLSPSQHIHNISKTDLENLASPKKESLKEFIDFVKGDILIAHNIIYDISILNNNLKRENIQTLKTDMFDSIEITSRIYPNLISYKLEYLLKELNIEGKNSHNALEDVKATVNLILHLQQKIEETETKRYDFITNNQQILDSFRERFNPIYNAVTGKFSDEIAISEIVNMIFGYMTDQLKYKADINILDEVDKKLIKHLDETCEIENILTSLKKNIPNYRRYKESDLILGSEKVVLITVHKAKGLEFENLIIQGVTDNSYPSYFSKESGDPKAIVEEARVLYVAITRAKKELLITSHNSISAGRRTFQTKHSRFLTPILQYFKD